MLLQDILYLVYYGAVCQGRREDVFREVHCVWQAVLLANRMNLGNYGHCKIRKLDKVKVGRIIFSGQNTNKNTLG